MPQSQRSLAVTEAYRVRLLGIRERLERDTRARWPTIEDFDAGSETWLAATAARLAGAQREATRATQGYLAAYLTSELGHRAQAPPLDTRPGFSRDGRPLTESLRSPLIGVLSALKSGKEPSQALQTGLNRALRMVEVDLMHAARSSLAEGMKADERIEGWQRGVRGTCGACAGDIAVEVSVQLPGVPLMVHPNCFAAGTEVSGPPALAATERWYEGEILELRFARAGLVTVTPNHPILTPSGWIAADKLSEGSDVIRGFGSQRGMVGVDPDDYKRPALIEQVAEAFRGASEMSAASVPVAAEDFHGDGTGGNVDVVWADRFRQRRFKPALREHLCEPTLCLGCVSLLALAGLSAFGQFGDSGLATSNGIVSGLGVAAALLGSELRVSQPLGLARASQGAALSENPVDGYASYAVPSRESLLRFTGEIETDKLVSVGRNPFSGHVYNLQTEGGWYLANGIVAHNCQCVTVPVVTGVRNLFPLPTGQQIFERLSKTDQDEQFGPEKAEALRRGDVSLADLVATSPMATEPDFITERPLDAVAE